MSFLRTDHVRCAAVRRGISAIAIVLLIGAAAVSAALAGGATPAVITITPRVGIGAVKLGETARAVQAALGRPRIVTTGSYAGYDSYRSGTITVLVAYDAHGRVDAIDTQSTAAVLYGHPLSQGPSVLRPVLVAHGWQELTCQAATFFHLGQGGAVTGIAWHGTRLTYAQVDASGTIGNACPPTV
jgi:hypothetical protein